jgi:hypothetical protein
MFQFPHTPACVYTAVSQVFLKSIVSFKKLDTIILRPYARAHSRGTPESEAIIKKCVAALKNLPATSDKRRLFISHECNWENQGAGGQLTGDMTEVDLS